MNAKISNNDYLVHGIILYVAWFGLGMLGLMAKRYFGAPSMGMHFLHVGSMLGLLIITVVMVLTIFAKYDWKLV